MREILGIFNNPDILSNPDNVAVLTNKVKKNLSDRLDFFQSHYDLLNDRITRAMQKRNLKPSDPDYAKIYRYVTDNWIAENAKNFPHFKKGDDVLKSWEVTINQIKSAL